MNCVFCNGQLTEELRKYIVDLGECVVIVKNVPAKVCQECGEATYSNEVSNRLMNILDTVRRSMISEVAIFEYSKFAE